MHHVAKCDVTKCCFNSNNKCHAVAIQVGDHTPKCDTFTDDARQCGINTIAADVGACKVTECRYNKNMICVADSIRVDWVNNSAECVSFTPES